MVTLEDLRNGDLLVFEDPNIAKGFLSGTKLVRLFTISNFGHVSIVIKDEGTPKHVEATVPKIRISEISTSATIYVVQMGLDLSYQKAMEFFEDKIGLKYGLLDALRAWLGITLKDEEKWQCAELCLAFYRHLGLDFPDAFTPKDLVRTVMAVHKKPLIKLNQS